MTVFLDIGRAAEMAKLAEQAQAAEKAMLDVLGKEVTGVLQAKEQEAKGALEQITGALSELAKNLTVTTGDENIKIVPFGTLTGEAIGTSRPTNPDNRNFILFVQPDEPNGNARFTVTGASTSLGFLIMGPEICGLKSGGAILLDLHGEIPVVHSPGIYPLIGYGELRNDHWRFAFGLMFDLLGPLTPHMLNWSLGYDGGNIGAPDDRGELRVERYFYPSKDSQITLQGALSQPIIDDFVEDPLVVGIDNGWPNIEARVALGLGPRNENADDPITGPTRPFEIGISGLIGQVRAKSTVLTNDGLLAVTLDKVSESWAGVLDFRWEGARLGVRGEAFIGQALGNYGGGIGQSLRLTPLQIDNLPNPLDGDPIRAGGGWGEFWFKPHCAWTIHLGGGVDRPCQRDLGPGQRARNQFYYTNLIWTVTKYLELGVEAGYWKTDYVAPLLDNEAAVYHFRTQLSFLS